jgi:hypothetical protein
LIQQPVPVYAAVEAAELLFESIAIALKVVVPPVQIKDISTGPVYSLLDAVGVDPSVV